MRISSILILSYSLIFSFGCGVGIFGFGIDYYQGYKKLAGRLRPSQMNIVDAINDNKKSLIEIEAMEERDFQTALFNKRNLAE